MVRHGPGARAKRIESSIANATDLASVVIALLHYAKFLAFSVVQKRWNHPDKQGGVTQHSTRRFVIVIEIVIVRRRW